MHQPESQTTQALHCDKTMSLYECNNQVRDKCNDKPCEKCSDKHHEIPMTKVEMRKRIFKGGLVIF